MTWLMMPLPSVASLSASSLARSSSSYSATVSAVRPAEGS
eukprot:CAMPEP_0202841664 /NCGR_PEP_ID=MMETSP1389-20130828/59205_1 /ASSEMBLY_ACC=CAM_ASM_000865 /TAXON_ID=302021 /ORGANISM="Rhodomonas sp., Strain CCMP768" /LENGTH=39 /DNA_ID= /DNA_START= /DNA_END= /DNA_ORIENTATION=